MRFGQNLQDDDRISGGDRFTPCRAHRIPGPAAARKLATLRRQTNLRGSLIAGDQLYGQRGSCREHACNIVGCAAADSTDLDRSLCCEPFLDIGDAARCGKGAGAVIAYGRSDKLELLGIKFDARPGQELFEKKSALKMTEGKAVSLSGFIDVVCADQVPRPRHIFHQERRIARYVLSHMAGERTCVRIKTATRGSGDNDANRLSSIKSLSSGERAGDRYDESDQCERKPRESFCHASAPADRKAGQI